jgi:DNA-binding NtrC family response regulator
MGRISLAGLKHFRSFRFSFVDEDKLTHVLSIGDSNTPLHGEYALLNLSLSGFAFISDQILDPEKTISLKITLQKKEYDFTGRIVRGTRDRETRNRFIYGVRLADEKDIDDTEFIENLVSHFKHKRLRKELTGLLVNEVKLDDPVPDDLLSVLVGLYSDLPEFNERGDFLETLMLQTKKLFRCEAVRFFEVVNVKKQVKSIFPFQVAGRRNFDVERTVFQKIIRSRKPTIFTCMTELEDDLFYSMSSKIGEINQKNGIVAPVLNHEQNCVGVIELLNFKRPLDKKRQLKYLQSIKVVCLILSTLYKKFGQSKDNITHSESFRDYESVRRKERNLVLVGESDASRSMRAFIQRYKNTSGPVLISGGPGTGKELLAKILHQEGQKQSMPLGVVDIAEWKDNISLRDFFIGTQSKVGKFELYTGGTLVLKNIDLLSKSLQEKFIEIFDSKYSIRLILTSQKDHNWLKGHLTADMRSMIIWNDEAQIHLPNMKERDGDLYLLIGLFLNIECHGNGLIQKKLSEEVSNAFFAYDWPGNVRELELAIKRCVWAYKGSHIISDLPETVAPLFDKHQGQYKSFRSVLDEFPRPLNQKEQARVVQIFRAKMAKKTLSECNGDSQKARERLNLSTDEWYDWLGDNDLTKSKDLSEAS